MTQQIKETGGVYQLIFQLTLPTDIKIGSLGVQHFEPGWYGYCGSAWGSGGLAARVGRHTRCLGGSKRPHWHVDFFREHARLVEVWFAHEPAEFEHYWSKAWRQSFFTKIPAPGMGATDCEECESHFLKFHQRPMTSRLRNMTSAIANRPIYSLSCEPALPRNLECDWEQHYWTGRDILEAVKFNSYAKDLEVGPTLHNLSGNKRLRELLNYEVTKGEKDFASCHEDVQLAAAIDSLIEEHGIAAHETLFFNHAIQTRKAVMQISRKSRERQHERLHSVWINDSTTVAPQGQDQAPDTMRFSKLFSRIGRARGSVMAGLTSLAKRLKKLSDKQAHEVMETLLSYELELRSLRCLVTELEINEKVSQSPNVSKRSPRVTAGSSLKIKQLPRQLKSGLSLLVKCNRDIPRTSYDIRPSQMQKARMLKEITHLINHVFMLRTDLVRVKSMA